MSTAIRDIVKAPIVDGGSKFDLMQQLMMIGVCGPDGRRLRGALFRLVFECDGVHREVHVEVFGVCAEDGSGDSWLIEGAHLDMEKRRAGRFKAYYNTKRRTGWIDVTYV